MSQGLISRSEDLERLQVEGYAIEICNGFLLIHDVPYVNERKEVARGTLFCALKLANDKTTKPDDHTVRWTGDVPYDSNGRAMDLVNSNANEKPREGVLARYSFSRKQRAEGYNDYYEKMTTYVAILENPAQALDPKVTAKTHRLILLAPEDSVFRYLDNASARAGTTALNNKLKDDKIAIVGLGGTGAYVLDLVAKTSVKEIHLFDGDTFYQHNAFRSPGAASPTDLEKQLPKVEYYKQEYSNMHYNIIAHVAFVEESNLGELQDMSFVFLCIEGQAKRAIVNYLVERNISFIDAGMNLIMGENETLVGQLRVTAVTPTYHDHIQRIPFSVGEDDEYAKNIQIAEMNALNAALAVIKWKKIRGYYHDFLEEHNSLYGISTNALCNDETPNVETENGQT